MRANAKHGWRWKDLRYVSVSSVASYIITAELYGVSVDLQEIHATLSRRGPIY